MSDVIGKLVVEVDMNKAKFDEGLNSIKRSLSTHTGQYKNLTRASSKQNMEWNKGVKALGAMRGAYQDLTNQIGYYNNKMDELEKQGKRGTTQWTKYHNEMQKAAAKMAALEGEYNSFGKELFTVNTKLYKASDFAERFGQRLQSTGQHISTLGQGLTKVGAIATAGGAMFIKSAMDYERGMVAIKKTTDMNNKELEALSGSIKSMAKTMPIAIEDLQDVAAIAGQLGVRGVSDITKFTDTMTKIGTATNLSAAEASEAIARFTNITGTGTQNVERIGSALVHLGNNLATTESEIMTLATRMVGTLSSLGASEADILGLAGAMSSVGISAELGGTAISKFFTDMSTAVSEGGQKLSKFAEVTKMTEEQFSNLFAHNPVEAFTRLVGGLRDIDQSGGDLIGTMSELGITNTRTRDTITRLVQGYDNLQKSMKLSNQAFQEGTALQREYRTMLGSTAAQWQILKNNMKLFTISVGNSLLPAVNELFTQTGGLKESAQGLADWFANLDIETRKNIVSFGAFSLAAGPVLSVLGNLVTVGGGAIEMLGSMGKKLNAIRQAYKFAKFGTIAGEIAGMSKVTLALGKALSALSGPWGVAAAGAAAAVGVYRHFTKESREAEKAAKELANLQLQWGGIDLDKGQIESLESFSEAYNAALQVLATDVDVGNSEIFAEAIRNMTKEINDLADANIDQARNNLETLTNPTEQTRKEVEEQIGKEEWKKDYTNRAGDRINELSKIPVEQRTDRQNSEINRLTHSLSTLGGSVIADTAALEREVVEMLNNTDAFSMEPGQIRQNANNAQKLLTERKKAMEAELAAVDQLNLSSSAANAQREEIKRRYGKEIANAQDMLWQALWAEDQLNRFERGEYNEALKGEYLKEFADRYGLTVDDLMNSLERTFEVSSGLLDGQIDLIKAGITSTEDALFATASEWNLAVGKLSKPLSELTENEFADFVDSLKEAGVTWSDLTDLIENGNLDEATKRQMERARQMIVDFNDLTLEEKIAHIKTVGTEDVQGLLRAMGLFEQLDPEQVKEIETRVQGGEKLSDILVEMDLWNSLSLEDKLALVSAEEEGKPLEEIINMIGDFNAIDPERKEAILEVANENGWGAIEFMELWNAYDLMVQEGLITVNDDGTVSWDNFQAKWEGTELGQKVGQIDVKDNGSATVSSFIKMWAFSLLTSLLKPAKATIESEDNTQDGVDSAKTNIEGVTNGDYNADIDATDNTDGAVSSATQALEGVGALNPKPNIDAIDNASSVAFAAQQSINSVSGKTVYIDVVTRKSTQFLKMGTRNHQGGLAVLGDGGRREPFLTPQGMFGVSPNIDTMYDLPRGTKVWPSISKFKTEANTSKALQQFVKRLPHFARGTDSSFLDEFSKINLTQDVASLGAETTIQASDTYVFNLDFHVIGDSISRSQADRIAEPILDSLDRLGKKTGRKVIVNGNA